MSYCLNALIGKHEPIEQIAVVSELARSISLPQGFALLPITRSLSAEIKALEVRRRSPYHRFDTFSKAVHQWMLKSGVSGAMAYTETELFGGDGTKEAVVWENGIVVLGPLKSKHGWKQTPGGWAQKGPPLRENAVNRALRFLGVVCNDHIDEFDALGLGRHRFTDEWIES